MFESYGGGRSEKNVDKEKCGFSTDLSLNTFDLDLRLEQSLFPFCHPRHSFVPPFYFSKLNTEHHYLDVLVVLSANKISCEDKENVRCCWV